MKNKRVIVIAGATASGKTDLGIAVALATGGEIVSADSMQIYKGMDIGTAKASADEQKLVRHHMIDVADPRENYSVARYVEEASACCDMLRQEGKVTVIVGGTGLYIDSRLAGRSFGKQTKDETLRQRLSEEYEAEGGEKLLEKLSSFDPDRAALLHPADKKRIVRAMEVYYLSGKTRTAYAIEPELRKQYDFTFIVLEPPREILYERIEERVNIMFEQGLEQEVKSLLESGYTKDSPALKAIGYHEWFESTDKEEIKAKIIHNTRKYAKKQYTYIRDIPGSIIVPFKNPVEDLYKVQDILKKRLSGQAR